MRCRPTSDAGSATVWSAALLGLLTAAVSAILLLASAIESRHAVERAADDAALAAAQAAMAGLRTAGDPQAAEPCTAAAQTLANGHLALRHCECDVLDCVVTVEGSFLNGLGMGPVLGGGLPVRASAQAGPVGESGQDESVGLPVGVVAAPDPAGPVRPRAPPGFGQLHTAGPGAADPDGEQPRRDE